jgi:hypothetical protein
MATLNTTHFMQHSALTAFVNKFLIVAANILKIDADTSNGGWCFWWYGVNIAPPPAAVPPKGTFKFSGTGGNGGYVWALAANPSGGSIVAGTGVYTAGTTGSVTDSVRLTDAAGDTVTRGITVGPAVSILPNPATVAALGTLTFTASGGSGTGWVWSIQTNNSGGATIDPATGVYTAGPTGSRTDVVKVIDSLGNIATRNVTVT